MTRVICLIALCGCLLVSIGVREADAQAAPGPAEMRAAVASLTESERQPLLRWPDITRWVGVLKEASGADPDGLFWFIYPVPEMPNSTASMLIFTDEENSLLLGRDLLQSSDEGETWDLVKTVYWDGQFSFVDERNGWAIARNQEEKALVQTEDGGRTWSRLDPVVMR